MTPLLIGAMTVVSLLVQSAVIGVICHWWLVPALRGSGWRPLEWSVVCGGAWFAVGLLVEIGTGYAVTRVLPAIGEGGANGMTIVPMLMQGAGICRWLLQLGALMLIRRAVRAST